MIEFNGGVYNILRSYQKDVPSGVRRAESKDASRGTERVNLEQKAGSSEPAVGTKVVEPAADEYSTVINFEYLPSGRLHLNHRTRQHIVDFFR